jgi:hypothetical protein
MLVDKMQPSAAGYVSQLHTDTVDFRLPGGRRSLGRLTLGNERECRIGDRDRQQREAEAEAAAHCSGVHDRVILVAFLLFISVRLAASGIVTR